MHIGKEPFKLEQKGPTIVAEFATNRSPVQHYARQQPEILFTLPPGFRPALDLNWEVKGWPVTHDGLPTADQADPRVFTVRVTRDGIVRYVDNVQVDGVGYLQYSARLAWPHAAASPFVCERSPDVRNEIVSQLVHQGLVSGDCSDITWDLLAKIRHLGPYDYTSNFGFLVVEHPYDLVGLQNVESVRFHNWGVYPEGMLAPVPKLRSLVLHAGSYHMSGPPEKRGDYDLPADLLAYTPQLTHLDLEVTTVEKLPLGFLAQVPELQSFRLVDRFEYSDDLWQERYKGAFYWPFGDTEEKARFLEGGSNLEELELELVRIGELPADFLEPVPNLKKLTILAKSLDFWPNQLLTSVPQLQQLRVTASRLKTLPESFPAGVPQLRQVWVEAPSLHALPETFLANAPRLESLDLVLRVGYLPAQFLTEAPSLNSIRLVLLFDDPIEWLLLYERLRQLNEDWLFDPDVRVGPGYSQVSVGRQQLCATWGATWGSRLTCSPLNGSPYTLAERFQSVSSGDFHSCGVTQDHRIKCWDLQGRQQLEAPAGEFLSVSVGLAHNCAVRTDETVVCWGDNTHGQTNARSGSYQAVTAGHHHSCGLRTDNTIVCWGDNRQGQSNPPSGQFREVSAGGHFSCALDANKYQLLCWGDNSVGQTDLTEIHKIRARIRSLDAGFDHACAAFDDVGVRCWGSNEHGQLEAPSVDLGKVSAGHKTTCGLTGGRRICWGWTGKPQDQVASGVGNWPYGLATTGIPLTTYRLEAGRPVFGSTDTDRSACPEQGPSPSLACDRELLLLIQDSIGLLTHHGPGARRLWPAYAPIEAFEGVKLSGEPPRVTELSFSGLIDIVINGTLPATLGRLTHLKRLDLSRRFYQGGNPLTGSFPAELGQLANLEVLDLSGNRLTGPLSSQIGQLHHLQSLNLEGNDFSGPIPPTIGNLAQLKHLDLGGNQMTGHLPSELGRLAGLESMDLSHNQLAGSIPSNLGLLPSLVMVDLRENQLTDSLPPELANITSLRWLHLSHNNLTGSLPSELGQLARLETLDLSNNHLTGAIPPELVQLSSLMELELSHNRLSGPLPSSLGNLVRLETLNLEHNQLNGPLPPTLGQLQGLKHLKLGHNRFSGELPGVLAQITGLGVIEANDNQLTGPIPTEWDRPRFLATLKLSGNKLEGPVSPGLGELIGLRELDLADNPITDCLPPVVHAKCPTCAEMPVCPAPKPPACPDQGPSPSLACDKEIVVAIQSHLWNLDAEVFPNWKRSADRDGCDDDVSLGGDPQRVIGLSLGYSTYCGSIPITGNIPPDLARLPWLQTLHLENHNPPNETTKLTGPIPPEVGHITLLAKLVLRNNLLTGPIPPEIGQLSLLRHLDIEENTLTGPIPPELGLLSRLTHLSLSRNHLSGSVPPELGQLSLLKHLGLSNNNLSGHLPPELGQLRRLRFLYLSTNQLSGPLPAEFGQLVSLSHADLSGNQLNGPLPPALSEINQLRLNLRGNPLISCLPREWRDDFNWVFIDGDSGKFCSK